MPRRRRLRFFSSRFETLESRLVPAAVSSAAGVLTISKQNGPLTVETTGVANQIQVTDSSGVKLINGINKKIAITGTNIDDTISIFADASNFAGDVQVVSGNGGDEVRLSGTFLKSVSINTGLGDDTVTSTVNAVSVGGSLTITDTAGLNTLDLDGHNYTVGVNLALSGFGVVDMGAANFLHVGNNTTIGSFGVNSVTKKLTVLFNGSDFTTGNNLTITGSGLDDVVSITSQISVGGFTSLNLGQGVNTFVLTPTAGGTGLLGNLSYVGIAGIDVVVFGASSFIGGNTSINMGNGVNTFVDTTTSQYNGNVSLIGGNNANTMVILGSIDGSLSTQVGTGDGNTVVFTGLVGGTFRYRSGDVGNLGTLTIAPASAEAITIDAVFGNGSSFFNLGPNLTLAGRVAGRGGANTFNPGTAILHPSLVFVNYP